MPYGSNIAESPEMSYTFKRMTHDATSIDFLACNGHFYLLRSFDAMVGDAKHNNHRMVGKIKVLAEKFGNESTLCFTIM